MMKSYNSYKESGIKWLGEIPEHWNIIRLKRVSLVVNGSTPESSNSEYWDGDINWVTPLDLGLLNGKKEIGGSSRKITQFGLNNCGTSITPKGSIILSTRAPIGHLAVSGVETCTNQGCKTIVVNQEEVNNSFLYYYLLAFKEILQSLGQGSTFIELSSPNLKDLVITCPNILEQQFISEYLDRKTAQIDTLIGKKQRQIELLQEQRTAIINQAVTKGLDPSAPMKDSNVEWLGEIPRHWDIKPIKYLKAPEENSFVDGPFGSNLKSIHYVENGEVYVIESGLITTGVFVFSELKTISLEHFESIKRSECKIDDIIIAKIGARYGTSGILPDLEKKCVVSGNALKLTVNGLICSNKYIHYQLLHLKLNTGAMDIIVNTTAQPALSLSRLNDLRLAVPPKDEQDEIVDYLDRVLKNVDEIISYVHREISLYQEYRASLISEAVTGKIDVRGEA